MDKNLFLAEIKRNGMTQGELAKAIGMAPSTLYRKIKSERFGTDEVKRIVEVLHINDPMPIFFAH